MPVLAGSLEKTAESEIQRVDSAAVKYWASRMLQSTVATLDPTTVTDMAPVVGALVRTADDILWSTKVTAAVRVPIANCKVAAIESCLVEPELDFDLQIREFRRNKTEMKHYETELSLAQVAVTALDPDDRQDTVNFPRLEPTTVTESDPVVARLQGTTELGKTTSYDCPKLNVLLARKVA